MGWLAGGGALASILLSIASPEIKNLFIDMLKSGIIALVISKVSKSIGESDIAEIIMGSGWVIIASDAIKIATIIANFFNK